MKFITLFATLAAVVSAALGNLTINTPTNVDTCEPTQFMWSGGTAPYYLSLIPAGQPTASPIKSFPTQSGTSYTWTVDLGSGTSFTISLKDSTGAIAYSDIVTIQSGSSTSCINTSVSETGTGGAASTGGSGSSAGSTAAAGTTAGATSAGSQSSATSTASGSSSTQSSAAGRLSVSSAFGVAGLMGLVGAALF